MGLAKDMGFPLMMFRFGVAILVVTSLLAGAFSQEREPQGMQVHATLELIDPANPALGSIQSIDDWSRRRESIRRNIEVVMGSLPDRSGLGPVEFQVLDETELDHGILRRRIEYLTEKGDNQNWESLNKQDRVRAFLFLPAKKLVDPGPAILCLHQTIGIGKEEPAGLGGSRNLHYALELARRGYVTLAPDYPSFGEHVYDFQSNRRWASGSMKAIWDNMRSIDLLEQLPSVDPKRIGCIGHSLGGHNTIFTSFFDERISVAVSSCGFTRFHKYYEGNLRGWTSDRYMPRIASNYSNNPELVPFDFPELIAGIAPRAFFTSSPVGDDNFEVSGVRETITQALKIYRLNSAEDKLQALYPDSAHDFPPEAREEAYQFIDRVLSFPGSLRN